MTSVLLKEWAEDFFIDLGDRAHVALAGWDKFSQLVSNYSSFLCTDKENTCFIRYQKGVIVRIHKKDDF